MAMAGKPDTNAPSLLSSAMQRLRGWWPLWQRRKSDVEGNDASQPLWRVQTIFNITDQPVFNLAFKSIRGHPKSRTRERRWAAIGRWFSHETFRMPSCVGRIPEKLHVYNNAGAWHHYAMSTNVAHAPFVALAPPAIVRCTTVGEPHWVPAVMPDAVYGYTHNSCSGKEDDWRAYAAQHWRNEGVYNNFAGNPLRGYLFRVNVSNPESAATLLSYRLRPESSRSAKNFLFFRLGSRVYVEALFDPHVVYELDVRTGYMNYSYSTPFVSKQINYSKIGLSASAARFNATMFIAAAHESQGGWTDAYRMTVFYLFAARPPFEVVCSTPALSFGFSKTLEYCTSLELGHGPQRERRAFVGFGYDNCFSALVSIPTADILAQCTHA